MQGENRIDFIKKYLNSSLKINEDYNDLVIDEESVKRVNKFKINRLHEKNNK